MVVTSALTACSGYMMRAYYCIAVFRRCPHFELGLVVVVVVSVAAVYIGNPGLKFPSGPFRENQKLDRTCEPCWRPKSQH